MRISFGSPLFLGWNFVLLPTYKAPTDFALLEAVIFIGSTIIEFRVEDVEEDYKRLADFLQNYIVQKPTTMPWGNKSLLFRDPDGNLINLFTPVTPEAIKKFESNPVHK